MSGMVVKRARSGHVAELDGAVSVELRSDGRRYMAMVEAPRGTAAITSRPFLGWMPGVLASTL